MVLQDELQRGASHRKDRRRLQRNLNVTSQIKNHESESDSET